MRGGLGGDEEGRAGLLGGVAVALSSARSVEAIMAALVDSLTPELCDACEVILANADGELVRVAAGPGPIAARRNIPIPDEADHPVRQVMVTGASISIDSRSPGEERLFGPLDVAGSARSLGMLAAILAPMTVGDRIVGALVAALVAPDRRWRSADREVVTSIATLAGLAIENLASHARAAEVTQRLEVLLDRQHHIAGTLQASLLPAALPEIPGAEVRAHYWPSTDDLEVGGDFYDVFPLGGSQWGLLVGDVCGKGVEAAAVTAAARHTARAAALHLTEPDVVLRWVHEAILTLDLAFCTIAYATFDHESGALVLCLGGHPRGVIVRADGAAETIGEHGTLLGMIDLDLHTASTTLERGDLLALYTDGITDVPGGEDMSLAELMALLATVADRSLDAIGAELHRELARRRPGGFDDDIALLLLRRH
ncbi:MAG: protein serine/threonine phosphatase [Acidimicrobiales bacterium]|nr:protein serine/threonine phosphatase [Acidimicrobiales bacterium]